MESWKVLYTVEGESMKHTAISIYREQFVLWDLLLIHEAFVCV